MRRRLVRCSTVVILALLLAHCRPAPPATSDEGPRLVVLIVVDQFRYDYLERYDSLLSGGLRWLRDRGVTFSNAEHDHATTVTAVGHAALSTGLHPSNSGMIGNSWFDRHLGAEVYSFADRDHGRSPHNLLGTTFFDWLKAHDFRSRGFTVSPKDRSAIALGGHSADGAFWYSGSSGRFVTSSYYDAGDRGWLAEFARRRIPESYFGHSWEPLAAEQDALEAAGVAKVDEGAFGRNFPYALGGPALAPAGSFYSSLRNTPMIDRYTLELARTMIEEEELGQHDQVDFLGIGLAALDSVGHAYGPNSPEVADTILRLDRSLGVFFDFVDRVVGLDRVLIALSSDHGVVPLPEYQSAVGLQGRRSDSADVLCVQRAGLAIGERFGIEEWVHSGFYLDRDAIDAADVEYTEIEAALARELERCPLIERVWTATELVATRADEPDRLRRLFRNSYHAERSPDLKIQLIDSAMPASSSRATHGSPYRYDTHVPMILAIPGIDPAEIAEAVRTVDLAPTIAAQLGVPAPEGLDGIDLSVVIGRHSNTGRGTPTYLARTEGR